MEKYESGFSEKAKREFDNALVDRKLYVFIFLFFFSNITKLVTATRKTGRGKKHRKKEKKKYQHDISSTMKHRCTQVVKTRGNPVSVDRRNTVRSLDK